VRRVYLTKRARRQAATALGWWLRNRDKAPEAFADDFEEVLRVIANTPTIGKRGTTRQKDLRRTLMERVRYYVYYRVTARDEIEVVAIWHASRRPPRL
jgi:plasmid stabilization system protein ParE